MTTTFPSGPPLRWGLSADEALYVAAGCRTVNLAALFLWVIVAEYEPKPGEPAWEFELGEIVLGEQTEGKLLELGSRRRDLTPWMGRWFQAWQQSVPWARALSQQVRAGLPAGIYEVVDGRWQRCADQDGAEVAWASDVDRRYANIGLWHSERSRR